MGADSSAAGQPPAGDGTADAAQDAGEASSLPSSPGLAGGAVPGEDERRKVCGRVVDSATGDVLEGVRVLVARGKHGWFGTRTAGDGGFEARVPDDPGDGSLVEVRLARPGYRTQVVAWEDGDLDAQLQPLDHVPQPGVVEGLATDLAGRTITGRILLSAWDEMGDFHGLWALSDDTGAFRLDGLAPGWWRLRLFGGGEESEIVLPDGGSTRVQVVAGKAPWPGAMTEEAFNERHGELSSGRPPGVTDEALSDAQREALAWQRSLAMQDLESRWRALRPGRPLVVTGLPKTGVAHLRAASTQGPNHSWRVPVLDGVARFPVLTTESWRLILEIPGEPVVMHEVTIAGRDADADPHETDTADYAWPAAAPPDER